MNGLRIVKSSLHDEAVARIRDMIVAGELEPGVKIPEKQLCESFGISRTPLREALKVLATEGLVLLLPNRGAQVARLTVKDIQDMFSVMAALEGLSGELACQKITDAQIAEVRALHYEMLAHYERRALQPYFRTNQAIHEAILRVADNPVLSGMYASLAGRIRRARYLANMSEERWAAAVAEHEDILDALSRRDGPALGRILRDHLHNKYRGVMATGVAETDAADAVNPGEETKSARRAG